MIVWLKMENKKKVSDLFTKGLVDGVQAKYRAEP